MLSLDILEDHKLLGYVPSISHGALNALPSRSPFRTTNTPTMPPGSTEQGDDTAEEVRMLAERELVWSDLPFTTRKGTIPFLEVQEVGRLDSAMTNREAPAPGEVLQGHSVSCIQWPPVQGPL